MFAKLAEIARSGVAVVLVEQNARAALALADRAYVLVQGQKPPPGPRARHRRRPASGGALFRRRGAGAMSPQFLVDGLVDGALIGLGAIGVTLTYAILRFANFAHGEFITFGAYAALLIRRRALGLVTSAGDRPDLDQSCAAARRAARLSADRGFRARAR